MWRLDKRMKCGVAVTVCLMLLLAGRGTVRALKLKEILKNTGKYIILKEIVNEMAGPLNDFINTLLLNNGVENKQFTKVVPVLTLGEKTQLGMAQIQGPKEQVDTVKSVFQIESRFGGHERYTVRAYIPSTSSNPFKLDRVHGVGITALVQGRL